MGRSIISDSWCISAERVDWTHGVAESVVKDLDPDLVRLGRVDRDLLNRDGLASLPSDGSLASDNLRE